MKKLLTGILIFISLSATAQKVDSAKVEKVYYLILTESKWVELTNIIKTADEKPSKVSEWIQLILSNVREVPKVDTTSKKPK